MSVNRQFDNRLRWQSQIPLFLAVSVGTAGIALQCVAWPRMGGSTTIEAFLLAILLASFTWKFRAATPAAALAGGLFTAMLYIAMPGWQTALWPLLALLVLTFAATRFGRARKEKLGVAEDRRGRTAVQVSANLGIAVIVAVLLELARVVPLPNVLDYGIARLALLAALAEAAADTLSSELGEVLGGEPRLLTTFRCVPAGTDGAISLAGSLAGFAAAILVVAAGSVAFGLFFNQALVAAVAAIVGLFVDSFLGALFERRGWLNNDAVNFLSTLASALLAFTLGNIRWWRA